MKQSGGKILGMLLAVGVLWLAGGRAQIARAQQCMPKISVDLFKCTYIDNGTSTPDDDRCDPVSSAQPDVSCNPATCQTYVSVCSSNDVPHCTIANGCKIYDPPCSPAECYVVAPTGTCGDSAYPQCNGTCSGGLVCKAIGATGSCNCGTATSCADYVPQPNIISTVRISPTSARFRWSALNTTTYPYVERIALVVEDNATNFNTCKVAAINGTASANCNVYQPNLAPSATSYTATGALTAGTEYKVALIFVTQDPPGLLPVCTDTDQATYLSSCELTPDPTTVA